MRNYTILIYNDVSRGLYQVFRFRSIFILTHEQSSSEACDVTPTYERTDCLTYEVRCAAEKVWTCEYTELSNFYFF
jgi:hypothetical protein